MAMGAIIAMATVGLLKGYGYRKQGKNIIKTADSIRSEYSKLSNLKSLYEKSLKEHKNIVDKIKGYQEDTAKLQYDKNSQQLKENLESNLRNVINQYVAAKENLREQALDSKSKILLSTPTNNIEESSIKHDTLAILGREVETTQRMLTENQINAMGSVTDENLEQAYRLGSNYDNTLGAIRKSYNTSIGNAELQYMQDINQLNSQIENGNLVANQLKIQGLNTIAEADNQIAGTLWNAGLGLYKNYSMQNNNESIYSSTTENGNGFKEVRGFRNYNTFTSPNPFNLTNINKNKFSLLGGSNGLYR